MVELHCYSFGKQAAYSVHFSCEYSVLNKSQRVVRDRLRLPGEVFYTLAYPRNYSLVNYIVFWVSQGRWLLEIGIIFISCVFLYYWRKYPAYVDNLFSIVFQFLRDCIVLHVHVKEPTYHRNESKLIIRDFQAVNRVPSHSWESKSLYP